MVPNNLDADEFTAEIRNDIVPALVASEANLAQITDPNFTLFLPGSVTHFADVTIDYGDVQMMRAMLDAATVFGYTLHTWNLDAQFGAVSNIVANGQIRSSGVERLSQSPDDHQPRRSRPWRAGPSPTPSTVIWRRRNSSATAGRAGVRRLFNLDTNEFADEQNFRTFPVGPGKFVERAVRRAWRQRQRQFQRALFIM